MATPDFLVVGHLVKDLAAGGWRPGGTVLYAALVAQRLGLSTAVVTSTGPDVHISQALPGVEVSSTLSAESTVFQNVYQGGQRTQFVRAVADPIRLEAIPPEWRKAPIVLLGPVTGEVDKALASAFPRSTVGLSAQGWLRHVKPDGRVIPADSAALERLLPYAMAVFASEEDAPEEVAAGWARKAPIVAYTQGRRGALLWHNGERFDIPAVPAKEIDPTGAGDAFAAAFLIRWRETSDVLASARFAAACASLVVEAEGATGAPTRAQIEWRLE